MKKFFGKFFELWLPIIIFIGVFLTVLYFGTHPKTAFGYEITTTPTWMFWCAWIVLFIGTLLTILGAFDVITWTQSDSSNYAVKVIIMAVTVILTMLLFINFTYDFNNPYV